MSKLNKRQQLFITEYCKDMNAEQAAIRAGYSEKYARSQSYKLLANVGIKTAIDETLEAIRQANIADATEVELYLTSVMRGESEAEIVVIEGAGEGYSNAKRIMKAPDERERLKAAELLGKRYCLFTDKVKHDGAAPVIIVNDLDDDK